MPSPICLVKEGSGSYVSTDGGVNATPGATMTIKLNSIADVRSWSIQCVYTDELSDADTVTAGLSINPTAKTATFTAPASQGRTLIFESKINGGIGPDGQPLSTYTTTFGIYTLAAASRRTIAANETIEGDSVFGYIASLNQLIRNPPGSWTAGGDLTGSTSSQQVVSLTGAAGSLPLATTAALVQWASGTVAPTLRQADISTNSGTGANLLIRAQSCTGTTSTGGNLLLASGSGTSTNGTLNMRAAGSDAIVWSVNPTGQCGPTVVSGATSVKYSQSNNSTNSATGATTTIQAQNATGTSATGGTLNVTSGTGTSAAGNIDLQTGGTSRLKFTPTLGTLTIAEIDTANDTKGTLKDVYPLNVQTTDATVTTLGSFTIPSNTGLIVTAVISAVKSDLSQAAAYIRTACFRNNAGTVAQVSTTQNGGEFEDDSTWDATIDNSTTTIRVRVTGRAATTIRWTCTFTRLEVIP
jgi:hypothetical protein